jgi:rhodanese-related sulfurtransferase
VPWQRLPAFQGQLDDAAVDDLVALLRSWAPAPVAQPPMPMPPMPPIGMEPPLEGPIVINPGGAPPTFTLREERFVAADQVKHALDAKNRMVIIDARPGSEWIVNHIPGAVPMAHYQKARFDKVPKDGTWVIAYCACPHHLSGDVVDELRRRGYTHTAVLDEGILVWQQRKYPVVPGPMGVPLPPPSGAPVAPGLPGMPPRFMPGNLPPAMPGQPGTPPPAAPGNVPPAVPAPPPPVPAPPPAVPAPPHP